MYVILRDIRPMCYGVQMVIFRVIRVVFGDFVIMVLS